MKKICLIDKNNIVQRTQDQLGMCNYFSNEMCNIVFIKLIYSLIKSLYNLGAINRLSNIHQDITMLSLLNFLINTGFFQGSILVTFYQ